MNTIRDTKQYFLTPKESNITVNLNKPLNSHIRYYFNNIIDDNPFVLYNHVKLSHAEIIYSFYIINEYNNRFNINNTNISIPYGNYNAINLRDVLNELLILNGINVNVSFNSTTGKYLFTSQNTFTITSANSYKLIGLEENATYTSILNNGTGLYQITANYLAYLAGTKNIYVKTNFITENLKSDSTSAGVLKSIPVNVQPYGFIMYNNNENIESLIKNKSLPFIEIELLDDEGNLIDFNNLEWSLTLEIITVKIYTQNTILLQNQSLGEEKQEKK